MFRQKTGIPMYTNCVPLIVDLFLYAYATGFRHWLVKNEDRKLDHTFNSRIRYINDVLSQNNIQYSNYLHLIYQISLRKE